MNTFFAAGFGRFNRGRRRRMAFIGLHSLKSMAAVAGMVNVTLVFKPQKQRVFVPFRNVAVTGLCKPFTIQG
jgi:hypothetical protein